MALSERYLNTKLDRSGIPGISYKIGKTFYITRVSENTANTITGLGTKQIRTRRRDRKKQEEKEVAKNMLDHGLQIRVYAETYLFHLKDTTVLSGILQ